MSDQYGPKDAEALYLAAELTRVGRTVELERYVDGTLECVEVVDFDKLPAETRAALEETDLTPVTLEELRARAEKDESNPSR